MTTETKTTRGYMKHTYAPGLTKKEKAKQRRLTRAERKANNQPPAVTTENTETEPVSEPTVENPEIVSEVQPEPTPDIEATKANLKEALNRRDRNSGKKHKTKK